MKMGTVGNVKNSLGLVFLVFLLTFCEKSPERYDGDLFLQSFIGTVKSEAISHINIYENDRDGFLSEENLKLTSKKTWQLDEENSIEFKKQFHKNDQNTTRPYLENGIKFHVVVHYKNGGVAALNLWDGGDGMVSVNGIIGTVYVVNASIVKFTSLIPDK